MLLISQELSIGIVDQMPLELKKETVSKKNDIICKNEFLWLVELSNVVKHRPC